MARVLSLLVTNSCNNEIERADVYKQALSLLSKDPLEESPVVVYNRILNHVIEVTGKSDPFLERKQARNQLAKTLLPVLERYLEKEEDKLHGALKAASAGNILDAVAVGNDSLVHEAIRQVFEKGFVRDSYQAFAEKLEKSVNVFYIGDNSGEIIFDSILVKYLHQKGKKITFCVRGTPAMDDALVGDFYDAGLERYCDCVDTGGGWLGYIPELVPEKTKAVFEEADVIIAKGMGNFEAMYEIPDERIFFAFKAKCDFISQIAGVNTGDFCFLQGGKI